MDLQRLEDRRRMEGGRKGEWDVGRDEKLRERKGGVRGDVSGSCGQWKTTCWDVRFEIVRQQRWEVGSRWMVQEYENERSYISCGMVYCNCGGPSTGSSGQ